MDNILDNIILSASGFRGIFTENNDEESKQSKIPATKSIFAAACALAFSNYTKSLGLNGDIILARDTRPTGNAIADAIIPVLLKQGRTVRWLDVCAAPEIMSYAKSLDNQNCQDSLNTASGFIYISASHNPIGHNGLKFGLTDGGVLQELQANVLIDELKTILNSQDMVMNLENILNNIDKDLLNEVYKSAAKYKNQALRTYEDFTRKVITGFSSEQGTDDKKTNDDDDEKVMAIIRKGLNDYPLGVCADFNGSARTVSIDRDFIAGLGAGFKSINDKPGEIDHKIVPEGDSLIPCREFLESSNKNNPEFILGYMPDCDGDRGNLVIWDNKEKKARALEAQEVFALSCVAELSFIVWTGQIKYDSKGNAAVKAALAVNGATSLRVDRIAEAFGISIFRAETGEANVVSLARRLRGKGFFVRILGEGSNGGSITHPAAVRDPLNALSAIIKLLSIRSKDSKKGLYEIWCERSDQMENYREDFSLGDIIASMPVFHTTSVVSANGVLKVKSTDHSMLKNAYQGIFLKDWDERKAELYSKYGIANWDAESYNGSEERQGLKNFSESKSGGLKISFFNDKGRKIACIWMRGSKTEPLFRIMADTEGPCQGFEQDLLDWQRSMLIKADT